MMDALTVVTGIVIVAMLPQAVADLRRMVRAMRLYISITGAVSADKE